MTDREKIINIIEQNKYCDVNTVANCRGCKYSKELENYKDMGCSTLKAADALIAANIGDVTEYKEIIRDLNTDVVVYRALSKADSLEQIIEGQKSLIDEYKHRAEVAERKYMIALNKYAKCDRKLTHYNKMTTTYDKEITKQAEREIEEEKI